MPDEGPDGDPGLLNGVAGRLPRWLHPPVGRESRAHLPHARMVARCPASHTGEQMEEFQ